MSEEIQAPITTVTVTVCNKLGLHVRAVAKVVALAKNFAVDMTLTKEGKKTVSTSSLMRMLTLGAKKGTQLELSASGEDADEAIKQMVELFENRFGEAE
jgi:phosphotransferase system HPr (HPr) family protein